MIILEFSDDGICVYENWDVGVMNYWSDVYDSVFEDYDYDIVRESVRFSRD